MVSFRSIEPEDFSEFFSVGTIGSPQHQIVVDEVPPSSTNTFRPQAEQVAVSPLFNSAISSLLLYGFPIRSGTV
jgi:hypothetical protein